MFQVELNRPILTEEVKQHPLFDVLCSAIYQAMYGKGERHGGASVPFNDQPIFHYGRLHGRGFLTGQAAKKLEEAASTRHGQAFIDECLGAIVYLGAAIIREQQQMNSQASAPAKPYTGEQRAAGSIVSCTCGTKNGSLLSGHAVSCEYRKARDRNECTTFQPPWVSGRNVRPERENQIQAQAQGVQQGVQQDKVRACDTCKHKHVNAWLAPCTLCERNIQVAPHPDRTDKWESNH